MSAMQPFRAAGAALLATLSPSRGQQQLLAQQQQQQLPGHSAHGAHAGPPPVQQASAADQAELAAQELLSQMPAQMRQDPNLSFLCSLMIKQQVMSQQQHQATSEQLAAVKADTSSAAARLEVMEAALSGVSAVAQSAQAAAQSAQATATAASAAVAELRGEVSTATQGMRAMRGHSLSLARKAFCDAIMLCDSKERAQAARTRIVRPPKAAGGAPVGLSELMAKLKLKLGGDLQDCSVHPKAGGVVVVVRSGVDARARVGAAAAAVGSNLTVGPYFTPIEVQFRQLAHQFVAWAAQQSSVAQQCEFLVVRGVLHVKRAAPASGSSGQAPTTSRDTPDSRPYTYMYEHVERNSDGRLSLVDMEANHILRRAVQVLSRPGEGHSTTGAGGAAQAGTRRRSRDARIAGAPQQQQQQQQAAAAAAAGAGTTPPPAAKRASRVNLGTVSNSALAELGYGDMDVEGQPPGASAPTSAAASGVQPVGQPDRQSAGLPLPPPLPLQPPLPLSGQSAQPPEPPVAPVSPAPSPPPPPPPRRPGSPARSTQAAPASTTALQPGHGTRTSPATQPGTGNIARAALASAGLRPGHGTRPTSPHRRHEGDNGSASQPGSVGDTQVGADAGGPGGGRGGGRGRGRGGGTGGRGSSGSHGRGGGTTAGLF